MPPRMTTRSAGWPAAASRGEGTGGRAGRGGGRTRGCSGDQGNGRIDGQGGQVGGRGSEIMSPRMTTRRVGRPAAASRGGGMGGRADRGGGRTIGLRFKIEWTSAWDYDCNNWRLYDVFLI
uniref:Uncharacterized protein n=1 Tax=Tanacetum cinerariifolium TaxID=118510 RepID=A0A6L2MTW3_TANCI|nr:hypothetical protein [Tanacetum cinerariifolium]